MRTPTTFSALGLTALIALALAPSAGAAIAPDAAHSPNAEDQRLAYWVMLVVGLGVALALAGALLVAARRFRATRSDATPRRLEAGRGVIAKIAGGFAVLSLAIFVFGVVVSSGVREATADEELEEIEINAIAQQWVWRFEYPEQAEGTASEGIATIFSYGELVVPVDTVVNLNIDSTDVLHSWFVPSLGPQIWAVPGEIQETSFIADEEGVYEGQSTMFSGAAGYPAVRTTVRVVSAEEYEDYIAELNRDLQEGQEAVADVAGREAASDEGTADDENVVAEDEGEGES